MGTASYDFADEAVVVTGGSSGIGRAVARRFGDAGASVVVADVQEEPKAGGAPTHEAIREAGGEATFVETDVSERADVEAAVEAAADYGGVDVMVNNAGIFLGGHVLDSAEADFDRLFAVNVKGVLHGTQAAALDMLERDDPGTVVNTASISSTVAQPGHTMYNASKAAVAMVTRNAALDLAPDGLRVNAVAPGPISTEIGDRGETPRERERPDIDKDVPMGRSAEPEEIAGLYLALASEDASFVTGQLLYADGGFTIL